MIDVMPGLHAWLNGEGGLEGKRWQSSDIVADIEAARRRVEDQPAWRPPEHLMRPVTRPGQLAYCFTCGLHVDKHHRPLRLVKKPWK